MAGARIDTLQIASDPERWRGLGFLVDARGVCRLGATTLHLGEQQSRAGAEQQGIVSWTLRGARGSGPVDGLSTVRAGEQVGPSPSPTPPPPPPPTHPNGALSVDHVVVATPDFERTLAALAAVGMKLRRTRETANGARQAFFRHGEAILELVGPREPEGDGPASFWGLVATVGDIDLAARVAGPLLGQVRDAVQPGRRIATVARDAGLSVRLALITAV